MKVLVISHMYPSTFSETSGIFVHQQIKELQKQGCEVRIITPIPWVPSPIKHFSKRWKRYSAVPAKAVGEGIEVHYPRFLQFPRNMFLTSSGKRMYWGIRRKLDELYQEFKFDIIHAHVALPDGFAGMMVKKEYKKPLVVTIHGTDLHTTVYRNASCRKAVAKVFKMADQVVTVSTKLKNMLDDDLATYRKVATINNGIDPNNIAIKNAGLVSTYAGSKIILSVSHLINIKGLDLNINAMSQLIKKYPNLKYLVIGDGLELKSLRRLAFDLNLEHQIEFLGELPNDIVMQYMAIADIFSLPSWREGFGIVYLEAMAHGKPVIACAGEGITDVIKDGDTGLLVKPKDVVDLSKTIDFLLSNPEIARNIGERARKLVLENFTWEKNAQRYMKLYENLVSTNR